MHRITIPLLLASVLAVGQKPQPPDTFLGVKFGQPISQFQLCENNDDLFHTLKTTTPCREPGNEADVWVVRNQFDYNYPLWVNVRNGSVVSVETNFDPDDVQTFVNALTNKYGKPLTVQHTTVSNLVGGHLAAINVIWKTGKMTASLFSRGRAMDLGYFTVVAREESIRRARESQADHNRLNGKF